VEAPPLTRLEIGVEIMDRGFSRCWLITVAALSASTTCATAQAPKAPILSGPRTDGFEYDLDLTYDASGKLAACKFVRFTKELPNAHWKDPQVLCASDLSNPRLAGPESRGKTMRVHRFSFRSID